MSVFIRFITMLMIAQLGQAALAAGALITTIWVTLAITAISMLFSTSAVVGRMYGAGKQTEIGSAMRQALLLAFFLSLPVSFLMWNIGPILHFFGQKRQIIGLVQPYFHIAAFGMFPLFENMCFEQLVTAVSKAKLVIIWSIISTPSIIFLSYVLLFGKWDFPRLGIAGVAYAGIIVNWIFFIALLFYFFFTKYYKPFDLFKFKWSLHLIYLKKLFVIGWPISVQTGAELSSWCMGVFMMGWLGEQALAAQQIAMQCETLMLMIPLGIAQASTVLIGQAIGRKDFIITKYYGYIATTLGAICMLIVGIIYLFFPRVLIGLFSNPQHLLHKKTIHFAILLLAFAAFYQFFDSTRNILIGALRGFHDTKIPMWIGVLFMWLIAIPLGYIMAFVFHWGVVGLASSSIIAVFLGTVVIWQRFSWQLRQFKIA